VKEGVGNMEGHEGERREGHEGVGRNGSAYDVVAFNAHVSFKQWRGDGVQGRVQSKVQECPRVQGPEFRAKKLKK